MVLVGYFFVAKVAGMYEKYGKGWKKRLFFWDKLLLSVSIIRLREIKLSDIITTYEDYCIQLDGGINNGNLQRNSRVY